MFPILAASTSTIALVIASPFFANWLADGDVLFTHVKEGTAKAVMVGGSFDHFVMSLKGSHLNDPNEEWYIDDPSVPPYEIVKDEPGKNYESRGFLSREIGIYYVGLPPFRQVYDYKFSWKEMNNGTVVDRPDELTQVIYVTSFPYVLILKAAETADRIPVTITFQASVRVVNPYKALFDTENWLELVSGAIIGAARNYVGERGYSELVSEYKAAKATKAAGEDANTINPFSEPLRKLSEMCPDGSPGLHEMYGVVIERGDIQDLTYAGDNPDFQKAAEEAFDADQKAYATEKAAEAGANATRTTADANVYAIEKIADANAYKTVKEGGAIAEALKARLSAWGIGDKQLNSIIAQTEAMASQGPNRTVIWANSPLIASVGGLASALESMGIKTPEQLKEYFLGGTESHISSEAVADGGDAEPPELEPA